MVHMHMHMHMHLYLRRHLWLQILGAAAVNNPRNPIAIPNQAAGSATCPHAFRLFLLFFNHMRIISSFHHPDDYQAISEKGKKKKKKKKEGKQQVTYTKIPYILVHGNLIELLDAEALTGGFMILMIVPTCCTWIFFFTEITNT